MDTRCTAAPPGVTKAPRPPRPPRPPRSPSAARVRCWICKAHVTAASAKGKATALEAPEPKRWQRGQQRWGQGSLGGPVGREEQQRPEATCHEGAQQWTQLSLLHASRNFRIDLLWCYKIAKTREPHDTGSHPKLRPALDCRSSPAPEPEHCLNQDRSSNHEHFFQQSSSQSCSLTNSEWSEWAYDRSQPTPSQLQ